MSAITIFDGNFTLDVDSNVFILATGKHSYSTINGSNPWQLSIWVDGQLSNQAGGSGGITDAPSVSVAGNNIPAGTHNVKLVWTANNVISIRGVNMLVLCLKR
jgi:hypothetical protein